MALSVPHTPSSGSSLAHDPHHLLASPSQSYRNPSHLALAASPSNAAHHQYSLSHSLAPSPLSHTPRHGHGHHGHSQSVMLTPGAHPIHAITASAAPTPSHAASLSMGVPVAPVPAPTPAVPAAQIVPDLVRKLAAFRRGLVQERKQRQLLELQLEECQLRNEQLVNQQREQDVQLATSLELSAQLEHALHMSSIEPVQASAGIHERELQGIFAKPKKDAEDEIKRLFAELSTVQQYYHALQKRALSDKVAHEASALKLARDLKTALEALDRATSETRKYKMSMQEHEQMLSEAKEEAEQQKHEHEEQVRGLQEQIDELKGELASKTEEFKEKMAAKETQVEQLQSALSDQKALNDSLLKRSNQLASKVDSLELTLKRFTVTRILPGVAHNVSCEISIKKLPATGELWLCVKDRHATLPGASDAAAAALVGGAVSPTLQLPGGGDSDFDGEYMQELSTVRCRAVDEESVRGMAAADHETEVLLSMDVMVRGAASGVWSGAGASEDEKALFSPSAVAGASGGGLGVSHTVLLGYRPRFILCFTGDNHRCMIFECEQAHFRDQVCHALQHALKPGHMSKEQHIDELGRFFGDVQYGGGMANS